MGEVVVFPGIMVDGKIVRTRMLPDEPAFAVNDIEGDEAPPPDEDGRVEHYVSRLDQAKTPQAYLDVLKDFLDKDEYEMMLLAIMDREYLEDLDEVGYVFLEGYFKLMGFDPDDDPRVT